mmetsp:Transcript_5403/g.9446  ORF Transcript_5403/g.9446 Transcript_5403/m.9446 type:complete len:119 (-) Transcript_5403:233-589(-)
MEDSVQGSTTGPPSSSSHEDLLKSIMKESRASVFAFTGALSSACGRAFIVDNGAVICICVRKQFVALEIRKQNKNESEKKSHMRLLCESFHLLLADEELQVRPHTRHVDICSRRKECW